MDSKIQEAIQRGKRKRDEKEKEKEQKLIEKESKKLAALNAIKPKIREWMGESFPDCVEVFIANYKTKITPWDIKAAMPDYLKEKITVYEEELFAYIVDCAENLGLMVKRKRCFYEAWTDPDGSYSWSAHWGMEYTIYLE